MWDLDDYEPYEDPTPDYEVWERNQLDLDMQAEREDEMREAAEDLVYESRDVMGYWGFTGCDQDCYESREQAVAAAYRYLFGDDSEDDIDPPFDYGAEEQQRIDAEMGEPRHDDVEEF